MYRGYEVLAHAAFRVTRNSNLYFEEEEARSLLETIRVELHNRRKGDAVRLEIESGADPEIVERLRVNFELDEDQVFPRRGPGEPFAAHVPLRRCEPARPQVPALHAQAAAPEPQSANIFDELRQHDVCSTIPTTPTIRWSTSSSRARKTRRAVDEADPLPHQPRLADVRGAD
jgi:polyphosphate kinase